VERQSLVGASLGVFHTPTLFSTNFIVFIIQNLSGKNLRNLSKLNSGDNASKRNVPFEGI